MASQEQNGGNGTGGDKVVALLPWDIAVRRARSRRHAHELMERKDADAAIRALSEVEAYYLVKEVGLESAVPVLAVLEPDQIRAIVDLDVWQDDRVRADDLLLWLAGFLEAGGPALSRAARSMDPELLALVLGRRLHIALKPKQDEDPEWEMPEWLKSPPDEILPLVETVDRRFVIAARTVEDDGENEPRPIDEEERKRVLELVDALYRDADYDFVAGVLRLAESDFASDLEESAYRFRTGRLEDLGFPERARAIEIYAPLEPAKVFAAEEPRAIVLEQPLPALHAERLTAGLFQQALRAIDDPETARRTPRPT